MGDIVAREYSDATKHPDYIEEKTYLENTFKAIDNEIRLTEVSYTESVNRSLDYKKNHNRASSMDSIVNSIIANNSKKNKYKLEDSSGNPYFGRIDYNDDLHNNITKLYIGNINLIDEELGVQIVHYNEQIASLYYSSGIGRTTYSLFNYEHKAEILLKRQFTIENFMIKKIIDNELNKKTLDLLTNDKYNKVSEKVSGNNQKSFMDPILKEELEKSSDNKLNHIIRTIQEEQYKIISQPINQVTIVQGSAGSGKSTVAMHRISYLSYNKKVSGKDVAIIAPNKIFLDYISNILPDLDIQGIRQFTIESLGVKILEENIEVHRDEKLEYLINSNEGYLNNMLSKLVIDSSMFKSSLKFKEVIDNYLANKSNEFIQELKDIVLFNKQLTIHAEQLKTYWNNDSSPFNIKIDNLKGYIENKIDAYINKQSSYYGKSTNSLLKERIYFTTNYFHNWRTLGYKECYLHILNNLSNLSKNAESEALILEFIKSQSIKLASCGRFEREDIAPLCYIKMKLLGVPKTLRFEHIVIDEAQDLSVFEYVILRMISRNNSFTIMGDLSQGINYHRAIKDWRTLEKDIFESIKGNIKYFTLKESYRSTKEIVNYYIQVLPNNLPKGNPVYRTGDVPLEEAAVNIEVVYNRVLTLINYYKRIECSSIAVITKSSKESINAYNRLINKYKGNDMQLLTSETATFSSGVTITSVANSKGLEFDAVIIVEADDINYKKDELNAKLLYVAMSRALHFLHVFYCGNKTLLLEE